jgi:peptide/nickel transport system permease protein
MSVPAAAIALPDTPREDRREWLVFLRRLAARRTALFGMLVVGIVVLTALAAPLVSPFDPIAQDLGDQRLKPPAWRDAGGRLHPLGTDHLGRDLLARVIFGARPALLVGFAAVAISGILGLIAGLVSGYFGGRMDDILMRLADIQLAFPFILLAIAVIGVLGPSLTTIIVVIGVSSWVVYARIVRGAVLSLREREFVQAARVIGVPTRRILFKELLPNLIAPIIVSISLGLPAFVAAEAGLAYLGIGATGKASWGQTIDRAVPYFNTYPLYLYAPVVGVFLLVMALNLLGDAVRDAFDPKTRR